MKLQSISRAPIISSLYIPYHFDMIAMTYLYVVYLPRTIPNWQLLLSLAVHVHTCHLHYCFESSFCNVLIFFFFFFFIVSFFYLRERDKQGMTKHIKRNANINQNNAKTVTKQQNGRPPQQPQTDSQAINNWDDCMSCDFFFSFCIFSHVVLFIIIGGPGLRDIGTQMWTLPFFFGSISQNQSRYMFPEVGEKREGRREREWEGEGREGEWREGDRKGGGGGKVSNMEIHMSSFATTELPKAMGMSLPFHSHQWWL